MPYKTGSWGKQALERSRKRSSYFIAYRKKFPDKWRARALLNYAVKTGKIKKLPCRDGTHCKGRIEAHHPDHRKPLEVIWFCPFHHRQEHKR